MPVPIMAPMPSSVRSHAVKLRLSERPLCSTSLTSCSIDFVANRFESIPPPSQALAGSPQAGLTQAANVADYRGNSGEGCQILADARFGIAFEKIGDHRNR